MKRNLKPLTNPAGYMSAAGAVYAAAVMVVNVVQHHAVFNASVAVAGAGALASFFVRQVVTPVADPHDGSGKPLAAAAQKQAF